MERSTDGSPDLTGIRHDGARDALAKAIDELTTSDGFARWLEARSTFHDYSLNNTLMILSQCPTATRVAGYKAWQKLGRQVRKGERGLVILAPMVVKVTDSETGAEGRRVLGFKGAHVFDVSQTEGDDLPAEPLSQLAGQDEAACALNARLLEVVRAEGLSIEFEPLGEGLNGYYQREQARIVLALDLSPAQQAKTLTHELAHHFDPDRPQGQTYREHRGEAETVAESAAFIVTRAHGLDSSAYSVGYVASWADGDSSIVYKVARRIDQAADAILAGIAANETAEVAA